MDNIRTKCKSKKICLFAAGCKSSVTRCWNKKQSNFTNSGQKGATAVFTYKVMLLTEAQNIGKYLGYFCFRKCIAKKFQKSPNLVTLCATCNCNAACDEHDFCIWQVVKSGKRHSLTQRYLFSLSGTPYSSRFIIKSTKIGLLLFGLKINFATVLQKQDYDNVNKYRSLNIILLKIGRNIFHSDT